MFPCDDSMVVIVDDREDVWTGHIPNLVLIEPYTFFPTTNEVNQLPRDKEARKQQDEERQVQEEQLKLLGESSNIIQAKENPFEEARSIKPQEEKLRLTPIMEGILGSETTDSIDNPTDGAHQKSDTAKSSDKNQEGGESTFESETAKAQPNTPNDSLGTIQTEEPDLYLFSVLNVLKKIHSEYYQDYRLSSNPDVKKSLRLLKAAILKDVHIVFSHVFPRTVRPIVTPLGQKAVAFGAIIHSDLGSTVTHVVADNGGTEKVQQALNRNVFIVRLEWLLHCIKVYKRVDETLFPLDGLPTKGTAKRPQESEEEGHKNKKRKIVKEDNEEILYFDDGIDLDDTDMNEMESFF